MKLQVIAAWFDDRAKEDRIVGSDEAEPDSDLGDPPWKEESWRVGEA
jgi:hypothetical protein